VSKSRSLAALLRYCLKWKQAVVCFSDDSTRVKLSAVDDEPGSDYINANYIPVSSTACPVTSFWCVDFPWSEDNKATTALVLLRSIVQLRFSVLQSKAVNKAVVLHFHTKRNECKFIAVRNFMTVTGSNLLRCFCPCVLGAAVSLAWIYRCGREHLQVTWLATSLLVNFDVSLKEKLTC